MRFNGLRVYDIEESIIASGFPMLEKEIDFEAEVENLKCMIEVYGMYTLIAMAEEHEKDTIYTSNDLRKAVLHIRRFLKLGNAIANSGHDCALKGITVNVNITAPQHFWLQWERYHFQDTISSMSSMHRITKFDIKTITNEYVDPRALEILKEKIDAYNAEPTPENFHRVVNNIPEGIELTRRIITNYLQLKTMYAQRKCHKMFDWSKNFTMFVKNLPYFEEFTLLG